jgi:hypothetical protein
LTPPDDLVTPRLAHHLDLSRVIRSSGFLPGPISSNIANNKHFKKVKRYLATEKLQEASTSVNLYWVQGTDGWLFDR